MKLLDECQALQDRLRSAEMSLAQAIDQCRSGSFVVAHRALQRARETLGIAESGANETPDFCFDADDWETTYAWSDRDELTMDLSPGDSLEVSCLKQLPTKWAACIVRADDWETLWFDNKEDMENAVSRWRSETEHGYG